MKRPHTHSQDDFAVWLTWWPFGDSKTILGVERMTFLPEGYTRAEAADYAEALFCRLIVPRYGVMCCRGDDYDDVVFDGYLNAAGRPYMANIRLRFGTPCRSAAAENVWLNMTAYALSMLPIEVMKK